MSGNDVLLDDVWKEYRAGRGRRAERFWALKGLQLAVARGEAVGIIGRNGAGKSTLLKLLAGITAPTRGRITITGRLSALIEVGSGFHPELTGRENVFLSGAILGMARRDIAHKLSSIFEFAGVGAFIDTPVKWYSSGMYVRLGFSVAAHLDPDILLIDEVLAVGDAEFQARCINRVHELKRRGVTILLISHDLSSVEQLCDRAVLLERGQVAAEGRPADVVAAYHQRLTAASKQKGGFVALAREGAVKVTNLTVAAPASGQPRTGAPLVVTLRYEALRALPVRVELSYYSGDGQTLVAAAMAGESEPVPAGPPGGEIEFTCPVLALPAGAYYVGAVVREASSGHVLDWWDGGTRLHVDAGTGMRGQFYMPHVWRAVPADACARAPIGAAGMPSRTT